jgi:ubiquinone/menaquinone biosynthesis C-methylase UbiE
MDVERADRGAAGYFGSMAESYDSLALAARYPAAALTLVDGSSEMLAVTRERLAATPPALDDRLRLVEARFESLAMPPAGFDLVTSSISLHHVADPAALYRAVHALLVPGGRLCFADQMRGVDEHTHAIHWAQWLEFCRRPGHCNEEEIQSRGARPLPADRGPLPLARGCRLHRRRLRVAERPVGDRVRAPTVNLGGRSRSGG